MFFADEDYQFYLECLADAAKRQACDIHAYCADDQPRASFLVIPRQPQDVSKLMQSVGRKYVHYVNDLDTGVPARSGKAGTRPV
jgi:putative transposase